MCAANGVLQDQSLPDNARRDPRSLYNLHEILLCLSSFQSEEAELSNSLTELLSARDPIVASLSRLQSLVPHLDELHSEATLLSEKVSCTAQTAERVGGKVRSLDEEMRRVRESAERVGQIMDLKVISYIELDGVVAHTISLQSSLASLHSSIESQDWESATRYCARAMSLPLEVISGSFAENAVVRPYYLSFLNNVLIFYKAYIRKSSTTCSDITGRTRAALVNIPASFWPSV